MSLSPDNGLPCRALDVPWVVVEYLAAQLGVEAGTYGAVEEPARNRVNLNKAITHWPDMLKVAGSLVTNHVRAYGLLRMFGREGRPTPLERRSRSTGGSRRPSTCCTWSTRSTTPTGGR